MPYTLKPNKLLVKDPNGSGYLPQNVVTERTTSEMVSDITAAGNTQITAIGNKVAELDSKIDEADTAISRINALPGIIAGLRDLLDLVHPVGSVYISLDATDPGQLFGGTWEIIPGRFLLGVGGPKDNNNVYWGTDLTYDGTNKYAESPGTMGGEARHAIVEAELPEHSHMAAGKPGNTDGWHLPIMKNVLNEVGIWGAPLSGSGLGFGAINPGDGVQRLQMVSYTGGTGNNAPHNNMPPYYAVYMWRRTA